MPQVTSIYQNTIAGASIAGYNGDNILATAAELNAPSGVAVDNAGNIYIADNGNYRVRKINTAGIITTIAGTGVQGYNGDNIPATDAELNWPNYVAVDINGNVYVADAYGDRIRKIDTSGIITTFAGSGTAGYSGDNGPAISAKLGSPGGVYADTIGNVYIGDTYNNVVRKVNPAGIITTIAGNGTAGYSGDGGEAILAELNGPVGVATDAAYNIYIADEDDDHVRRVTSMLGVASLGFPQEEELREWPNPSKENFTINISSSENEQINISITDITGHKIKEMQATTNTSLVVQMDGPPGVYILYAIKNNSMLMERIVKQ